MSLLSQFQDMTSLPTTPHFLKDIRNQSAERFSVSFQDTKRKCPEVK